MCRRSDDDPLVRVLTDRYKLNILRQPRRGIGVGELLIMEGKDLRCAGPVRSFFDPELDIPLDGPVALPDVDGITSARLSASTAAAPFSAILAALGAAGLSSARASLRRARDISVAFTLTGTQYRSTNLVTLGDELSSRILRRGNALYQPGREFFVAHAIAEATCIKIAFSTSRDKAAELALGIAQVIKADASVHATTDQSGHLIIASPDPVTFGLAVVQLTTDGNALRLKEAGRLHAVRGEKPGPGADTDPPGILFGGADGDVLVEIGLHHAAPSRRPDRALHHKPGPVCACRAAMSLPSSSFALSRNGLRAQRRPAR
jgi:hypothetical protein